MQKLKMSFFHLLESLFTCFLKDKTLHNHWDYAGFTVPYYNIPSNNRELQLEKIPMTQEDNYNIPSNNRELQPIAIGSLPCVYYNIPSNNRELQRGAWYEQRTKYYNIPSNNRELQLYVVTFMCCLHYNIPSNNRELQPDPDLLCSRLIITYQVITGNYSVAAQWLSNGLL